MSPKHPGWLGTTTVYEDREEVGSPGDKTRTAIVTDVWIGGGSGECPPKSVFNSAMSLICLLSGGDFTKTPFPVVGASSRESFCF